MRVMAQLVQRLSFGLALLLLAFKTHCQVFDVTEYGAVGDGLTSDTSLVLSWDASFEAST